MVVVETEIAALVARYAWTAFPPVSVRGKTEALALFAPIPR